MDTCVFVSALRSRGGASHEVLRAVLEKRVHLVLSTALALEYEDVALRPGLVPALEPVEISKLIDGLCRLATHQKIFYTWRPFLPDADDDLVLELALAANARFVITHNVADFRKAELLGIHAITPAETLRKLSR